MEPLLLQIARGSGRVDSGSAVADFDDEVLQDLAPRTAPPSSDRVRTETATRVTEVRRETTDDD
jgi:hypothetical protein